MTILFRQAADRHEQLFYDNDTHLNPYGNELLATAVWEYLVQEKIVEQ
jgi:hypothetical protein